ncbi:unnamed protein product, partial [Meganyctiphanes norvegica]
MPLMNKGPATEVLGNCDNEESATTLPGLQEAIAREIRRDNVDIVINQLIRDVVAEEAADDESLKTEEVVSRLLQTGVIQNLVQRVTSTTISDGNKGRINLDFDVIPPQLRHEILPGRHYLYVKIKKGRAFVDHLEPNSSPTIKNNPSFTIDIIMKAQRERTNPILCSCDPEVNQGFIFDLQAMQDNKSTILETSDLLGLNIPITLVVVRHNTMLYNQSSTTTLLSVATLDWRKVLSKLGSSVVTTRLMGVGSESQVPVGLLDLELILVPGLTHPVEGQVVAEQLRSLENRQAEKQRLFIAYARQWWREYTEARTNLSSRPVRIFAMDERGKNRFVCEFVQRFECGSFLHSPQEASRWISLLPSFASQQPPMGTISPWLTLVSAISARTLTADTRSSLLCSILLGFGLNAWICCGTRESGLPHSWVLTRGPYTTDTFWEPSTGSRYIHKVGQKVLHDYASVGCVFNNQKFYANCQTSDKVSFCSFNLEESCSWKGMSLNATATMTEKLPSFIPLIPPESDNVIWTTDFQIQLKTLIIEHRGDMNMSTIFDERLSHILSPALWSYEREAIEGSCLGGSNEYFSAALMHSVKDGHTFKAFPFHIKHKSPRRAFNNILSSQIGREIVECRGDTVVLALRVLAIYYPEGVTVMWIMIACSFRPVG